MLVASMAAFLHAFLLLIDGSFLGNKFFRFLAFAGGQKLALERCLATTSFYLRHPQLLQQLMLKWAAGRVVLSSSYEAENYLYTLHQYRSGFFAVCPPQTPQSFPNDFPLNWVLTESSSLRLLDACGNSYMYKENSESETEELSKGASEKKATEMTCRVLGKKAKSIESEDDMPWLPSPFHTARRSFEDPDLHLRRQSDLTATRAATASETPHGGNCVSLSETVKFFSTLPHEIAELFQQSEYPSGATTNITAARNSRLNFAATAEYARDKSSLLLLQQQDNYLNGGEPDSLVTTEDRRPLQQYSAAVAGKDGGQITSTLSKTKAASSDSTDFFKQQLQILVDVLLEAELDNGDSL